MELEQNPKSIFNVNNLFNPGGKLKRTLPDISLILYAFLSTETLGASLKNKEVAVREVPKVEFEYIELDINEQKAVFNTVQCTYPNLNFEDVKKQLTDISDFAFKNSATAYNFIISKPESVSREFKIIEINEWVTQYAIRFRLKFSPNLKELRSVIDHNFDIIKCEDESYIKPYIENIKNIEKKIEKLKYGLRNLSDEMKLLAELDE